MICHLIKRVIWLLLFKKMKAVYYENHMKHTNIFVYISKVLLFPQVVNTCLCGKKRNFLNTILLLLIFRKGFLLISKSTMTINCKRTMQVLRFLLETKQNKTSSYLNCTLHRTAAHKTHYFTVMKYCFTHPLSSAMPRPSTGSPQ
jgi:hypothetical protein